ncbi:MAG: thioredoxin fold domain-containing protein [Ramlibacter sp.]|uniref:thioredoxin domain-containing protein n=1 Tax=Ramlibacter sp. TaxID=1917967 RepID=UPI002606B78D|nr:thioredoxin domain-containing protein [Ramlibacter sp.]MDH4377621.1 thioredoxin fold domain-containing protein [Ramlibacter sp.]
MTLARLTSLALRPARVLLLPVAAALALGLAGCKDSPKPEPVTAPKAAAQAVSVETLAAEGKGFSVGSTMAARTVYVFFDPQCPHCAALWVAAKPLKSQARFVWMPVSLINPTSTTQGATLLAAADPVMAMDQHEASMAAKQGGIMAKGDVEAQKAQVMANTALMNRYGFGSVPVIIGKHATTGELVVKEGALPTPALANALGLQVPAGN